MSSPDNKYVWNSKYLIWVFTLIPVFSCLTFALISNHVWEDYLIALRFSRNLAEGNGLVYNLGEKLNGITSLFNTMIPAFFHWIIREESIYPVLWIYRLISIGVLALAIRFLVKSVAPQSIWLATFLAVWVSFDIKVVSFSTNGQEVAFMILFAALAFRLIANDQLSHWFQAGLIGAGFMFTRPDGFIYMTIILGSGFLFSEKKSWGLFFCLVKAAAVTVLVYSPWLIIMWTYYGTPIPHTVVAKPNAYLTINPNEFWGYYQQLFTLTVGHIFRAIYVDHLGNPVSMFLMQWIVGPFLALFWVIPKANRIGRVASLSYLLICAYLAYAGVRVGGQVFPWYKPVVAVLGIIVMVTAFGQIMPLFKKYTYTKILWLLPIWFSFFIVFNYVRGTMQLTTHQNIIENQCRKEVGLWLAENAKPGDTGHSEPLGYIGFYSGLHMDDWPGLVSHRTVEYRKKHNNVRGNVIYDMKPDWLILRPSEFIRCFSQQPKLSELYYRAHVVDVIPILDEKPWIPGTRYHYFDAKFFIFRKVDQAHEDKKSPSEDGLSES